MSLLRCVVVVAALQISLATPSISAIANSLDAPKSSDELLTWLHNNGLSSFSPVFKKHRITGDVLLQMSRGELAELMAREQALVYGDVVRLEVAIHGTATGRASGFGGAALGLVGGGSGDGAQVVKHGLTPGLMGFSITGLTLTLLVISLAVSKDARKMGNIVTQLLSIQVWYFCRQCQHFYRRHFTSSPKVVHSPAPKARPANTAAASGPANFSGVWKLEKNTNYQDFLAFQGATWVEKKAADGFGATHTITDTGDKVRIQIASLLNLDTEYIVDGPPIETTVKTTKFMDTSWRAEDGQAFVVKKVNAIKQQEGVYTRRLEANGTRLRQEMVCTDAQGKSVRAEQLFVRQPASAK